jgi:hypothetical protein
MNSILDWSPAESAASISLAGGGSDACAEWRSISGWPEYQVSDTGEVRRIGYASGARVGRILRQLRNKKTGYLSVCLSRHAAQVRIDVHRLVAMAFNGPQPSADYVVAHNDGSRTNNHARNLRWAYPERKPSRLPRTRHRSARRPKPHEPPRRGRCIRTGSGLDALLADACASSRARLQAAWAGSATLNLPPSSAR